MPLIHEPFFMQATMLLGKKKNSEYFKARSRHLISYSTLLYKITKFHQLSEYLGRRKFLPVLSVSAVCEQSSPAPDTCNSSSTAGQQPGATGKHLEYCCQLITANFWLQHIFLKGLTTSNCTSVVDQGQHPSFPSVYYLNWELTFLIKTFLHIFHVLCSTTSFNILILDIRFPTRLKNYPELQYCTKAILYFSFWDVKQTEAWQPLVQNMCLSSTVH